MCTSAKMFVGDAQYPSPPRRNRNDVKPVGVGVMLYVELRINVTDFGLKFFK